MMLPDKIVIHKAIAGFTMIRDEDGTTLALPARVRDDEVPGASEWLAEAGRRYNLYTELLGMVVLLANAENARTRPNIDRMAKDLIERATKEADHA